MAVAAALVAASPLAAGDTVTAISRGANGVDMGDAESFPRAMTPDARYVVVASQADNLLAGQDPSTGTHLFLFDRISKRNVAIDHVPGAPTTLADGSTAEAFVSADGRFVAFDSEATNLVDGLEDTNAGNDVFLWDRTTDTVALVSRSSAAADKTADAAAYVETISADGRYVLYWSGASDLPGVSSDPNGASSDLLLFDRLGSTRLVTHADGLAGTTLNASSQAADMSADGNWVVYTTFANDADAGVTDANGDNDVYLWERQAPAATATRLLSRGKLSATTAADSDSLATAISADGGEVLFWSVATDVEGSTTDANDTRDLFVYDRGADAVLLVSRNATSATETANGEVQDEGFSISDDGEYVAYRSAATNVIASQADANGSPDLFLWTRTGAVTQLVSRTAAAAAQTANAYSGSGVALSADGSAVVFENDGDDLVAGVTDTNASSDLFHWSRANGAVTLLSHADGAPLVAGGNGPSQAPHASADAAFVAFRSFADDLVPSDGNGEGDAFYSGPAEIFTDGFESGGSLRWSNTQN